MSNNNKAHENKQRPARVPMTGGNKLDIPAHLKKSGHQYYWAVDRKGMIEQMEAAWWSKVKKDNGEYLTIPAGGGEIHYFMEIEQKYYDEDMARQQARNIDTTNEQAQQLGESEYVPKGRDKVTERELI